MYAPQILRKIQWRNSEISNLSQESMALFDEIFIMLEQIKTEKVNNYRAVWLRAYRGSLADMAFDDQEEALEYFGITDPSRLQEAFLKEYPNKVYWFNLESVNEGSYRHLRLRNFSITIVQDDLDGYPHNYSDLLTWIRDGMIQVMEEIQNGTYNKRVEQELPLSLRYGVIPRNLYWEYFPEDRECVLKDLTSDEIDCFIRIVESETEGWQPETYLPEVTFNQYLHYASFAFQGAGLDVAGKTPFEQFERYGEDFGGRILYKLDLNSYNDFLRYYNGELRMGGHPWGLRRGTSRSRIMMIPCQNEAGWYFTFSGDPNWNAYEMVKMYLALKKNNCPVRFAMGKEIIRYLRGDDLIGIVPETKIPVYCQSEFPGMEVNDFRHYDPHSKGDIHDSIEWLPIEPLKLIIDSSDAETTQSKGIAQDSVSDEKKRLAVERLMWELEKGANSGPYIDEKDVYRMLRKEWWKGLNKVWKQGRIPKRLSAMHVFLKKQK